jgi:hypothetical protein
LDLVVDIDALKMALGASTMHEADEGSHRLPFACAARDAVLARLDHRSDIARAWIIMCGPRREDRGILPDADVIVLDTPAEVCHERADKERPALWHKLIDEWFVEYEPDPVARWRNAQG